MYVPNNALVYTKAFAGAAAGMGVSDRVPTDQDSLSYAGLMEVAAAFAEEFDTLYPLSGLPGNTQLESSMIEQVCSDAWQDRAPQAFGPFILPETYESVCGALIAIVVAGFADFSGGSIPLPMAGSVWGSQFQQIYIPGTQATTGGLLVGEIVSGPVPAGLYRIGLSCGCGGTSNIARLTLTNVTDAMTLFSYDALPSSPPHSESTNGFAYIIFAADGDTKTFNAVLQKTGGGGGTVQCMDMRMEFYRCL